MTRWLKDILLFKSDRTLSFLLSFLVILLFVVYPFSDLDGPGKYVVDVFLSLVLISGTFAVERRKLRWVALALMTVTLLSKWGTYAAPTRELVLVSSTLELVFLCFASFVILGRVLAEGPITRHRVEGAVAVYLLIGLIFAVGFSIIAVVSPNAFEMASPVVGSAREQFDSAIAQLNYFSFVTLTTVGYGDITPIHPIAKQAAVLEGLLGQLYPALLLARLVSLQISAREE